MVVQELELDDGAVFRHAADHRDDLGLRHVARHLHGPIVRLAELKRCHESDVVRRDDAQVGHGFTCCRQLFDGTVGVEEQRALAGVVAQEHQVEGSDHGVVGV